MNIGTRDAFEHVHSFLTSVVILYIMSVVVYILIQVDSARTFLLTSCVLQVGLDKSMLAEPQLLDGPLERRYF